MELDGVELVRGMGMMLGVKLKRTTPKKLPSSARKTGFSC